MCLRSIFLTMIFLVPALANSAAPEHGNFDWKKFRGQYRFGTCVTVRSTPIWSDVPPSTYIEISDAADWDHGGEGAYLEMDRFNTPPGPIVPQWSLEKIDKGPQDRKDNTGVVDGHSETYSTSDGIFGILSWNRPYNIGWSTLQLRMTPSGAVSYEMQMRNDSDTFTRIEKCSLTLKH